jgi:hypothetical protein
MRDSIWTLISLVCCAAMDTTDVVPTGSELDLLVSKKKRKKKKASTSVSKSLQIQG